VTEDPRPPEVPPGGDDPAPREVVPLPAGPDPAAPPVPRPKPWPGALGFGIAAGITLLLDQASKLAMDAAGVRYFRTIIDGFFDMRYVENHGGAWGLLRDTTHSFRMPFFVATSILAIVFLLFLRSRLHLRRRWSGWAFPLIFGGAVGNLVDRIRMGYVIDFLEFHLKGVHWPTFNVADIGITVGVALLLLDSILPARKVVPPDTAASETAPPIPPSSGE
jgi:signal peptidase II